MCARVPVCPCACSVSHARQDSGKSWTKPVINGHAGQSVYSQTSDTIVMIVGWPPAIANAPTEMAAVGLAGADPAVGADPAAGQLQGASGSKLECTYYLEKYCRADVGEGAACRSCLRAAGHQVLKRGLCTTTEVSNFCVNGTLPPKPPPVPWDALRLRKGKRECSSAECVGVRGHPTMCTGPRYKCVFPTLLTTGCQGL